ncbi:NADP-dependent oxidoreductase [Microbacterium sp. UBA3394]|uniref:MDR family NADP-dependent oxidoreductase n=1 Tax=Microbacterium sp. UBA3394 TaxID=1946945 RepID=UPI00257B8308|nr:NADP-dependent oxidoreductase [Microbacterium sp. UBA3394]
MNRGWIVREPVVGEYSPDCIDLQTRPAPVAAEGEVVVRTLLLSIDPTTRNWLTLDPAKQFIPFGVGDAVIGSAVGEVVESRHPGFTAGDTVVGLWECAEYARADPALLERRPEAAEVGDEALLSVFSHVGRAATIGLLEVAALRDGDVVVVSGAAGATGSIAVQLAAARGNRVIAIAGGAEKCAYAREIGAAESIDYRSEDVATRLGELCPDGVDVYFDNVGGATLDAVLAHMAVGCRIALCGAMSQYDLSDPSEAYGVRNLPLMLWRRARIEGYVVPDFADRFAEFDDVLRQAWADGGLRGRSHVVAGLENAATAVRINLDGSNRGKVMVRVGEPSAPLA